MLDIVVHGQKASPTDQAVNSIVAALQPIKFNTSITSLVATEFGLEVTFEMVSSHVFRALSQASSLQFAVEVFTKMAEQQGTTIDRAVIGYMRRYFDGLASDEHNAPNFGRWLLGEAQLFARDIMGQLGFGQQMAHHMPSGGKQITDPMQLAALQATIEGLDARTADATHAGAHNHSGYVPPTSTIDERLQMPTNDNSSGFRDNAAASEQGAQVFGRGGQHIPLADRLADGVRRGEFPTNGKRQQPTH